MLYFTFIIDFTYSKMVYTQCCFPELCQFTGGYFSRIFTSVVDFNDLAEGQRVARPVRTRSRRTLRGGHFRWCELEVKPVGRQIFGLGFDGDTMYVMY